MPKRSDKIFMEEFPNIFYLTKTLETREKNEEMRGEDSSKTGSSGFTGTESYEEAIKLLYDGAQEIAEKIRAKTTDVDLSEYLPRRQIETGVVGYVPHVPNAILGLPNSMIKSNNEPMKNKALMITTSICGNCNIEASDMEKAGVAILGVVNALELSGHRVKLRTSFFDAGGDNGYYTMATVNVKDYSEHLDLRKLAFPVAHPSMFRRIGFKWLETVPNLPKGSGFSFGYGHHVSREIMIGEGMLEENEVYLDYDTIKRYHFDVKEIIKHEFKK